MRPPTFAGGNAPEPVKLIVVVASCFSEAADFCRRKLPDKL